MEHLLHYTWKHKIFPLQELTTTDGRTLQVLNPGLLNTDAGPDFIGAVVIIDNVKWVGNVEMHMRSSDWFLHHHQDDPHYDNIILHVACNVDRELLTSEGTPIPQFQLPIPDSVAQHYNELASSDTTPPCASVVSSIPRLTVHNWLSTLQVERLEMRTRQIMDRRTHFNLNWEDTFFATLARHFGFGKNGDAFEQWAKSIPLSAAAKHRDNLFQIEALFFGQAGLLNDNLNDNLNVGENYYLRLQKEYKYLRQKFSLTPIDPTIWKFLRLRPQNFPHIRIAQLAMLYHEQRISLSKVLNTSSVEAMQTLFHTQVSDYWKQHYNFRSSESATQDKRLSPSSVRLLIINAIVPTLFAYGRYKNDEVLCSRALSLWEELKPESNSIIRNWTQAGITPQHAADTQALLHLHTTYCLRHDCLRCRFGAEYIGKTPDFLREDK